MRAFRTSAVLTAVLCLVACGGGGGGGDSGPTFISWTTFQDADLILGQVNATSNDANQGGSTDANTLASPGAPCVVGARLFVPDLENNRVLGFNAIPATDGAAADFVLGQVDLMSGSADQGGSVGPTTLHVPWAVCEADGKLFVSDTFNNRVLVFNAVPTTSGVAANVALGQADLMSEGPGSGASGMTAPRGIHAVGTRLLVCDLFNNRVLIWNTIPTTSGAAPDLVLGQANLTNNAPNDVDGDGMGDGAPSASTLFAPFGVWSDGTRVAVADGQNNRVLIWNTFPTTNGQAADLVLGQAAFNTTAPATSQTGMRVPTDVTSDGTKLIVGDCENNRILIYDAFPVATNTAPTTVIGQGIFTLGTGNDDNQDGMTDGVGFGSCTARTMNTTGGFAFVKLFGTRLWSGDFRNHRAVAYDASAP